MPIYNKQEKKQNVNWTFENFRQTCQMMTVNMALQDLSFLDFGNATLSELAIISLLQKPNPADVAALWHTESYFHRPTVAKKILSFGTCRLGGLEHRVYREMRWTGPA